MCISSSFLVLLSSLHTAAHVALAKITMINSGDIQNYSNSLLLFVIMIIAWNRNINFLSF